MFEEYKKIAEDQTSNKENLFYSLIKEKHIESCLEIGSHRGRTTWAIISALDEKYKNKEILFPKLICVDPYENSDIIYNEWKSRFSNKTNFSFDPILIRDYSQNMKTEDLSILMAKIDFAFIDGDHSYEANISDFQLIEPILSRKAIVFIDDINDMCGGLRAYSYLRDKYYHKYNFYFNPSDYGYLRMEPKNAKA